jgi:Growth-Arrest-Specific Protein 2 Domain
LEIRPQVNYTPTCSDKIDCKVAEEINIYIKDHNNRLDIPFRKLKEGLYKFGTLKVITRIRYGSLIIRVGGGYTTLKEFLNNNLFTEKNKVISGPFFKDFIAKRAGKHK